MDGLPALRRAAFAASIAGLRICRLMLLRRLSVPCCVAKTKSPGAVGEVDLAFPGVGLCPLDPERAAGEVDAPPP
jgi:hypothetical protein